LANKTNFSKLLKNAKIVQSVSQQLANSIYKIESIKVNLTNHPLDLKLIKMIESSKSEFTGFRKETNTKYFLYVGELSKEKGVDTLLESFLFIGKNNIKLILVGEGEYFESVKDSNIEFLGVLSNFKVLKKMAEVDFFVFPTRFEGMPNVLKEAGALGLPIIANGAGGIPEFLDHGSRGYLLKEVTVDEIVTAINFAIEHESQMLKQANELQRFVMDNFDVEKTSKKLEKVYQEVLLK
jgi:glycosyltransferase involved in cell wall biosynthesis